MVRQARNEWLAKGRLPGWEGMARMLELAFKLKQFAAGMPSEIKQVNETHTTQLRVESEVALKKVYGPSDPGASEPAGRVVDVAEVGKEERTGAGEATN